MTRHMLLLIGAVVVTSLLGQLMANRDRQRDLLDDALAVMRGPAQLVAETLANLPPPERLAEAERLSERFGYRVRFETETRAGVAFAEWREGEIALIAPLPDGLGQAVLGPVPMQQRHVGGFPSWLATLLLASLLVVAAAYPLMRRVRVLERLAGRMCEGDFAARLVSEPGEDLSRLGASLNQLADRIGQLLSDERDLMRTVSHEVRAPISRMRFRIAMLQEGLSEQASRHADGLVSDLKQVDALFEELLTYVAFDEFDHERPALTTTTFELGEVVRQVVAEIADTAPQVSIAVEGAEHALVVANRKLFERAVANLVRNAVGYCNSHVWVIMRSFPGSSVVDVQDDGPGIPEAERPRVIKPFVRLELGKKVRGTGLGLAIVTRIMRLHHGSLHLVDAPRGGASCQLVWNLPSARRTTWRDIWARQATARGTRPQEGPKA